MENYPTSGERITILEKKMDESTCKIKTALACVDWLESQGFGNAAKALKRVVYKEEFTSSEHNSIDSVIDDDTLELLQDDLSLPAKIGILADAIGPQSLMPPTDDKSNLFEIKYTAWHTRLSIRNKLLQIGKRLAELNK